MKIDRMKLEQTIRTLDGISDDERAALLQLLRTKKYGLVWEDQHEDAEDNLREHLPVLVEDKELAITAGGDSAPNHIIIEGDNLEALVALTYTHEGKVDVIYIDPPYNTGNKDFVYNDNFVDREDDYRHSKWLSFMSKRLRMAKRLLSEKGVIFISIDDNEQANLKLLCDEVFGEDGFVCCCPTIMNLKGNQDEYAFAGTHEYTLVYVKDRQTKIFNPLTMVDDEQMDDWKIDERGYYKKGACLKATGVDASREKRPNLYFPIYVSLDGKFSVESPFENSVELLPITNGKDVRWRWSKEKFISQAEDVIVVVGKDNGISLYKKQRPEIGDLPSVKPKSLLYKPEYSSGNGTNLLRNILGQRPFNNPKPLDLIKDLLMIGSTPTSTILDFFAGSGTTLHATMQLNAEDGGNRKCISVNITEASEKEPDKNICRDVTYERNRRVIEGYTTPAGKQVEGLKNNNLRYYRCDGRLVKRNDDVANMRTLAKYAVDLLCIKEDVYDAQPRFGELTTSFGLQYFESRGQGLLVILDTSRIEEVVEQLTAMQPDRPVHVYLFSGGSYAYDEEFEEVADKVTLCALPEAIAAVYRRVMPKQPVRYLEEDGERQADDQQEVSTPNTTQQ